MWSSDRHLLLRDVRTIELAFEGHVLRPRIRSVARFGDAVAARDDVHHAATAHDDVAGRVALGRAVEREHVLGQAIEAPDRHSRLRRSGVVLRAEDHVDVVALAEADRLGGYVFREAARAKREEELREVALDPRKRDLGLRVAEAR